MIDLTRLKIKSGDVVECIPTVASEHGPGYATGRIFTVDHFVISGMKQLLYDSEGQYVFSDEVVIYDKKEEETIDDKNKASLIRILEVVFPDNWCLESVDGINRVIVRFPEFVIRNSRNETHTIRGLYVKVSFDSHWCISSSSISGMRAVLLERERSSSYRHSHLPTASDFTGYSTFCTGGDMIAELGMMLRNKNVFENEDMYENYFETLNTYVRWESLEGGPYKRLSSIAMSIGDDFNYGEPPYANARSKTFNYLAKVIKEQNLELPITLNIKEDRSLESVINVVNIDRVILSNILKDAILRRIETSDDKEVKDILCLSTGGSKYRLRTIGITRFVEIAREAPVTETVELTEIRRSQSPYKFKGEPIQYVLLRERGQERFTKSNIEVSESVLDGFIKDLIKNFYGKFYEKGYDAFISRELEHESCIESIC